MEDHKLDLGVWRWDQILAELSGTHYFELDPFNLACVIVGLTPMIELRYELAKGDIPPDDKSGDRSLVERRKQYKLFMREFYDRNGLKVFKSIVTLLAVGDIYPMGLVRGLWWASEDPVVSEYMDEGVRSQIEQVKKGEFPDSIDIGRDVANAWDTVAIRDGRLHDLINPKALENEGMIRAIRTAPVFVRSARKEMADPDYQPTIFEWQKSRELREALKGELVSQKTLYRWYNIHRGELICEANWDISQNHFSENNKKRVN